MTRYGKCFILGMCLLGMFLAAVESVWAFDNNGFQTNGVYATELRRWIVKWDGRLFSIRESDGYVNPNMPPQNIDDYGVQLLDGYHWDGITFSGAGCDDARLFMSMTTWHTYRAWGSHTGIDSATILEDTVQGQGPPDDYQQWGYMVYDQGTTDPSDDQVHEYALDDMIIRNLTDGSEGTVQEGTGFLGGLIDGTHVELEAPGLTGGTDNLFQVDDLYEIACIPNPQAKIDLSHYYGKGYCKPYDFGMFEWGYTYGRHGNDVIITEYGPATAMSEATQLNYAYLYNDLLSISPQKVIRLAGSIRFNPLGNSGAGSLFVPVNEDVESDTPLKVYEIDLGLTTVLNTYTGPNIGDERPSIAVNLDDGTLYAIAPNLDSPPPADPETDPIHGDLIAWDTSGGSTSTYTTLVDSDANGGYPHWNNPHFIVYRGTNNPSGRPTILVDFNDAGGISDPGELQVAGIEEPAIEFYLDETDANGNLAKRGNPLITGGYILANGQLDRLTGTVWLTGERPNDVRGLIGLNNDDSHFRYPGPARYYKFRDVASPGVLVDPPCEAAPLIVEVSPDPDPHAYIGIEYVRQMELETSSGVPAPTWSLVSGPTGATIDSGTGLITGWTPSAGDVGMTFTFEVNATNALGSDTESWSVKVYNPEVVLNNGFRKDWVYQVGNMIALKNEYGQISTFYEEDGAFVEQFWAGTGTNWYSCTFSGTGNSDARLFAFRPSHIAGQNYFSTDVYLAELDDDANIVNSAYLGELAGLGQGNLGANVLPHNIRYNAANDTLMVGINPDSTSSTALIVYEIDLGLSTIVATYTGPVVGSEGVGVDVNPEDGTLYVTNWDMGSSVPESGLGDLIAFDTSGGTTSSYTTLIDGDTIADVDWAEPTSVVYRGENNPSGRPTILVLMGKEYETDITPQMEFYLDETDPGTGNLVKRAEQSITLDVGWNGQLDTATGTVWLIQAGNRDGVIGLKADDIIFNPTVGGVWRWTDVDSPPSAPICNATVFADADSDGDVDQDDFAIFQICYTGADGGVPSDPVYCECFDSDNDNDVDGQDFTAFQDCATGPGILFDSENPPPLCNP